MPFPTTVAPGRDVCREYLRGFNYAFCIPTALLYRADLVRSRDPFFVEGAFHADTLACLEILDGRDFGFVHRVVSYERIRADSMHREVRESNLYLAERLDALTRYGHRYFDKSERQDAIDRLLRRYDRFLAGEIGRRRGAAFWRVHRQRRRQLGYPLRPERLLARAAVAGAKAAVERTRAWLLA